MNIQERFLKVLQEEDGDVFRDRDSGDAFRSTLDDETQSGDFDTEGLGFDPTEKQENEFLDIYSKVINYEQTISDLIDPDSGSLLQALSRMDRNDSIAKGAVDRVRKDAKKVSDSLSSIINEMKIIASMEESLRRKVEALNQR